jgi:hypothetical protein
VKLTVNFGTPVIMYAVFAPSNRSTAFPIISGREGKWGAH